MNKLNKYFLTTGCVFTILSVAACGSNTNSLTSVDTSMNSLSSNTGTHTSTEKLEAVKPDVSSTDIQNTLNPADQSTFQIDYYDTDESEGIMTLEAANHWAKFDFESNPSAGEHWSYILENPIVDIDSQFEKHTDANNINEGVEIFTLTPNALGETKITFNYGKDGEEPEDTMIYTFVIDEDLQITCTNAENPHGDKSIIVKPVVK